MRSSTRTSFFLLALLLPLRAPAETPDFEVYQTQTRTADELQKAAAGVMNGGRVSILDNNVVIYGTKAQRSAVLRLFAKLDHPLHNFVASFRVAQRGKTTRDATSLAGSVQGRNAFASANGGVKPGAGGGTVGVSTPMGQVSASAASQTAEGSSESSEQLLVMDGGSAQLYSGAGLFPKTVSVSLRSLGNAEAHLEVREADPNAMGEQALVTEINVPLGEWRSLGGVTTSTTSHTATILGGTHRSVISADGVQVKVEVAK